MTTIEELMELTKQMNDRLEADNLDNDWLEQVCNFWQSQTNIRFRLLDFEYYNEERLKTVTEEKLVFIKERNFEAAANKRDEEKKFIKHVEFKKQFGVQKSLFDFDDYTLVYLYTGTAKNDRIFYSCLTAPEKKLFSRY